MRAKTDRLDGEALVRALLAYKRGDPRVCAMVAVPSVDDEDRRRIGRERRVLVGERIRQVNRIKVCCSRKASLATSRCEQRGAPGSKSCGPGTDVHCLRI
jgi:transposase